MKQKVENFSEEVMTLYFIQKPNQKQSKKSILK